METTGGGERGKTFVLFLRVFVGRRRRRKRGFCVLKTMIINYPSGRKGFAKFRFRL